MEDVKALLNEILLSVPKEKISKRCKHAIEIESKYNESNLIMDDVSEWIVVIYLGDDSNKESYHSE